nr:MAG TPA: hypothetical protein [Caudoviricetes sp.]
MRTDELYKSIVGNATITYSISSKKYSCAVQIRHIIYNMEINQDAKRTLAEILEDFYNTVIDNINNDFIINTLKLTDIKSIF